MKLETFHRLAVYVHKILQWVIQTSSPHRNLQKPFSSWLDTRSVFVTPHDERHVMKLWNSLATQPHWNRGQITHINVCFFCVIVSGFSAYLINWMVQWFLWYLSSSAQILLHMAVVASWLSTTPQRMCHYRHMQDSLSTCTCDTCSCIYIYSWQYTFTMIIIITYYINISSFYHCYSPSKLFFKTPSIKQGLYLEKRISVNIILSYNIIK